MSALSGRTGQVAVRDEVYDPFLISGDFGSQGDIEGMARIVSTRSGRL
jgi:hypothetical protein